MFEWLGRLAGMSLRFSLSLPFAFPRLVWKALLGQPATPDDLPLIDAHLASLVADLRTCTDDGRVNAANGEAKPPIDSDKAFAEAFPHLAFTVQRTFWAPDAPKKTAGPSAAAAASVAAAASAASASADVPAGGGAGAGGASPSAPAAAAAVGGAGASPSSSSSLSASAEPDDALHELVAGGRDVPVTLANRLAYADAAERFRLHEFDYPLAALRRGFINIVPLPALRLLTPAELERLVCGVAEVDLAVLRAHTEYQGYSAEHVTVQRFWRIMERLTHEERSRYLQFVWARSRLPANEAGWASTRHIICRCNPGDSALVRGWTCRGELHLPDYSSEVIMEVQLRTSIEEGLAAGAGYTLQ